MHMVLMLVQQHLLTVKIKGTAKITGITEDMMLSRVITVMTTSLFKIIHRIIAMMRIIVTVVTVALAINKQAAMVMLRRKVKGEVKLKEVGVKVQEEGKLKEVKVKGEVKLREVKVKGEVKLREEGVRVQEVKGAKVKIREVVEETKVKVVLIRLGDQVMIKAIVHLKALEKNGGERMGIRATGIRATGIKAMVVKVLDPREVKVVLVAQEVKAKEAEVRVKLKVKEEEVKVKLKGEVNEEEVKVKPKVKGEGVRQGVEEVKVKLKGEVKEEEGKVKEEEAK